MQTAHENSFFYFMIWVIISNVYLCKMLCYWLYGSKFVVITSLVYFHSDLEYEENIHVRGKHFFSGCQLLCLKQEGIALVVKWKKNVKKTNTQKIKTSNNIPRHWNEDHKSTNKNSQKLGTVYLEIYSMCENTFKFLSDKQ